MHLHQARNLLLSSLLLGPLLPFANLAGQNTTSKPVPKYRSHFVTYDMAGKTKTTLFTIDGEWHSINFTPDGKYIISDMGGELFRIPLSGPDRGKPEKINVSEKMRATNDHAVSWDGKQIAITSVERPPQGSGAKLNNPLFIINIDGSGTHKIHQGWLHAWSPDGSYVLYVQSPVDNYDLYRINVDGSGELQLTANKGQDDGPEYTADGKWIYFCSNRSGNWEAWRMPPGGAGPDDKLAEKVTDDSSTQNWFPHVSPDGKWLYLIAYPSNHPEHTYIGNDLKIKLLRLENGLAAKGATLTTVATFFGGQGSSNTGGWSPDSKQFSWTEYEPISGTTN